MSSHSPPDLITSESRPDRKKKNKKHHANLSLRSMPITTPHPSRMSDAHEAPNATPLSSSQALGPSALSTTPSPSGHAITSSSSVDTGAADAAAPAAAAVTRGDGDDNISISPVTGESRQDSDPSKQLPYIISPSSPSPSLPSPAQPFRAQSDSSRMSTPLPPFIITTGWHFWSSPVLSSSATYHDLRASSSPSIIN